MVSSPMIKIFKSRSLGPFPIPYERKIHSMAEPDQVEVLLEYPGHIHYLPEVEPGEVVSRNQTIGRSRLGNHVHAPVSGTIEKIETVWSPFSEHVPAVVIRNDKQASSLARSQHDKDSNRAGSEYWVEELKQAGVPTPWTLPGLDFREVDLGELPDIKTVIIKGVHEEPTIFTSQLLLREETERIIEGMKMVAEIAPGAVIWLTTSRSDAKWARDTFDGLAKIDVLPDNYRGRITRHVVPRLIGAQIPNLTAYRKLGIAVMSVEYLIAFCEALEKGKPLTRKCLTIAGDGIDRAVTVRIPMGTSIRAVLESQGISTDNVGRIIVGGPMQGISQYSSRVPLTHVDGLYLMAPGAVPAEANNTCINCGRCTRACPASIQVHLVNRYAEYGLSEDAQQYHPEACHGCGLCAYVCPAERSLVQLMRLCSSEKEPD